jgi:hypothetical protein
MSMSRLSLFAGARVTGEFMQKQVKDPMEDCGNKLAKLHAIRGYKDPHAKLAIELTDGVLAVINRVADELKGSPSKDNVIAEEEHSSISMKP